MTKIITNAYFRSETDVSQNIENSVIDHKIKKAQDQLQFILGRNFYNQLAAQAMTNPQTFDTNNAAFFDPYVKQYLAWQAYEYYVVRANTYETRMGLRIYKESNSDAASDKTMGELIARAKEDSLFYKGKMINYLMEMQQTSPGSFPLYIDKWPQSKMGPGFQITSVRGRDKRFARINTKTVINSDAVRDTNEFNYPNSQQWP